MIMSTGDEYNGDAIDDTDGDGNSDDGSDDNGDGDTDDAHDDYDDHGEYSQGHQPSSSSSRVPS